MKRLLWVVVISFVVFAPCANADSILNINITYVTATMSSNGGVFVTLIGPAHSSQQTAPWHAKPGAISPSPT